MTNKAENLRRSPFTEAERNAHKTAFEKLSGPEKIHSLRALTEYMRGLLIAVFQEPRTEDPIEDMRATALNLHVTSVYKDTQSAEHSTNLKQNQVVREAVNYIRYVRSQTERLTGNDEEDLKKIKELAEQLSVFFQENEVSIDPDNGAITELSAEQLAELKQVLFYS